MTNKKPSILGSKNPNYRHGECAGKTSKIYWVWGDIIGRTTNPKHHAYKYYGGRGILVCEEWSKSSASFIKWAKENGYKEGLIIDREDNNGNYCPANCRFVTIQVSASNKRKNPGFGIYYHKDNDDYEIALYKNKVRYHNGRAKTFEQAIIKRDELLIKIETL